MPLTSPSNDYSTVVIPPATAGSIAPNYPRQMFNPNTLTYCFVADATQQAAVIAADGNWTPVDPFTTN